MTSPMVFRHNGVEMRFLAVILLPSHSLTFFLFLATGIAYFYVINTSENDNRVTEPTSFVNQV